jgi:hypothetical protein
MVSVPSLPSLSMVLRIATTRTRWWVLCEVEAAGSSLTPVLWTHRGQPVAPLPAWESLGRLQGARVVGWHPMLRPVVMARQKWTPQDQLFAEVAAACGVPIAHIGKAIGRSSSMIMRHLVASIAERDRTACRERMRVLLSSDSERKRINQNRKRNRFENLENYRAREQSYRDKNKQKLRECSQMFYRNNQSRILSERREWRLANKDKVAQWSRAAYQNNKDRYFASARRRSYLKRSSRIRALHHLTRAAENARFALWHNRCAFCGVSADHPRNTGFKRLTTEHVLALSKGGLDEECNIMPACATCNKSKGPRPLESWYRSQPFFTEARWRKIKRHCPAAAVGQLSLAKPSELA